MRHLTTLGGIAALALATCGCDAQTRMAVTQEMLRHTYVEEHGPTIVASIVGASFPMGGPGGLNGLCTDQGWRMWVGNQIPDFERVPSMFELPDPNRPVKITTVGRTQHVEVSGE